ncbi:hypothetical protein Sste5346_009116 [Sporothrix stenoceras]|uniref:Peroxin 20 n=1 Tax=Sporothrix stenoceras TaxID=5173 RepID=A0ABR3YMP3_9PEZI
MSDDLCGPSTALKSFSEHVNRDRSVHQDRAAPGRAGPSNFRSVPNGQNSNEAEARAFAAGGAAFQADPMMGPDMAMNGHMHHPPPPQFQQMGPRFVGPSHGHAVNANNWAAEFASTNNAGPAAAAPSLAGNAPAHASPYAPQQAVNRLQHFSSGMMAQSPSFLPSSYQPNFAAPQTFSSFTPQPSSAFAPTAAMSHIPAPQFATDNVPLANDVLANTPSGVAGLTEAELEARFAAFDTADDGFEDEMGAWMAQHGPAAEQQGQTATEQEDVDAIMERMADELDAQRLAEEEPVTDDAIAEEAAAEAEREAANLVKDQDDLARTAGQIVSTLDSNSRFQQSSFLRLMRRIQDREVTVQGDTLVDGAGQPIEPATTAAATTTNSADQDPAGQPQTNSENQA